jgi:exopolyphosphatase / guanosine-5'-triphosphate,3'-diphosphate pyrophosphatase
MITAPRAVIDIGSNAIRLVVYGGPPRAPMPIYNEKARISLGDSVAKTGVISTEIMDEAIAVLRRFSALTKAMRVEQLRVVATEATRTADNGSTFIERAADAGVVIELISGEKEAIASALGVVCDIPWATGYVADQGGGSLELARLADSEPTQPVSMPYGTIPISNDQSMSVKSLAYQIEQQLKHKDDFRIEKDLPLHLVGGAWRTLGQLHMAITDYPLAILSNYRLPLDATIELAETLASREAMEATGVVSNARLPFMPAAAMTIEALVRVLRPSELLISVYGLREGLLFDQLSKATRAEDPLIAAARHEGARLSRFAYHGDRIAEWIAPIFADDPKEMERLRHAACLLADSVWNSHPEYRAEHAAELALEGNLPGVTASDRATLAAALYAAYGGKKPAPPLLALLAPPEQLSLATRWGSAIRLAQRLDGGTGVGLSGVSLSMKGAKATLDFQPAYEHLDSATVKRRLRKLIESIRSETSV